MQTSAAIYLRVSLDHEMDGRTIDRHRQDCQRIARERGWTIHREYVDQSISATDKAKTRPGYDAMVADYQAGKFSAIICWDLDRLTRQPRQLEDWIEAAEDRGLVLVTANGEADLSTDGGRLFARMKAAVARSEVERKGRRQSSAQAQRARQGRAPKGIRPLGYALNGDILEDEAKAVQEVYAAFLAGSSLRGIARALSGEDGENVPADVPATETQTRRLALERNQRRAEENKTRGPADQLAMKPVPEPKPWNPASVLMLLRNPRYAGYSTYTPKETDDEGKKRRSYKAKIVRTEDGEPVYGLWEPIIDENTWWKVQEKLDSAERVSNRSGTERKHMGSGLYLCGICGTKVRAHGQRYRCAGHVLRSREQVDTYVLTAVRARLGRDDLADLLPDRDEPRLAEIRTLIEKQEARIRRAQRDYDDEIIEGRDLKRIRSKAEAAIAKLDAERLTLSVSDTAGGVLSDQNPVSAFEAGDLGIRRSVVDALCEVHLHHNPKGRRDFRPETVEIVWRR